MSSSIPALGVERAIGYPRVLAEPFLWLAFVLGWIWLLVALDVRKASIDERSFGGHDLGLLASSLALVLILNGAAGLLLQGQTGWASRGVAVSAGLGIGVSGWVLGQLKDVAPSLRDPLAWGCYVCGAVLVVAALTRWRVIQAHGEEPDLGAFSLVVLAALALAVIFLVYLASVAFKKGLVGVEGESAWHDLTSITVMLTGVLSALTATYRRSGYVAMFVLVVTGCLALFIDKMPG